MTARGWCERIWLRSGVVFIALVFEGLALAAPSEPWVQGLNGDAVVLLGEVHDNAELHAARLATLRRSVQAGWRPAIAMEQFDTDRQADIDRARRERPADAQHLIDQAAPKPGGWDWTYYRPVVALALEFDLPLLAANLSGADTRRVVREGLNAVFDSDRQQALGLDRPLPTDWQAAQEREIDSGHCGALPASVLPKMALAQFARDAVMASVLKSHASRGVVLLAGNGHVRRDLGVPRWLGALTARAWVVGYLEAPADPSAGRYDAVILAAPAARPDPCAAFARPASSPR